MNAKKAIEIVQKEYNRADRAEGNCFEEMETLEALSIVLQSAIHLHQHFEGNTFTHVSEDFVEYEGQIAVNTLNWDEIGIEVEK